MTAGARNDAILEAWTAGQLSSSLAVMELLLMTGDVAAAVRCIEEKASAERTTSYDELRRLIVDHPEGCRRAVAIARRFDEAPLPAGVPERVVWTRHRFDEAVGECEEASVALYSLGSADMLRAATDEVVNAMHAWGLLGEHKDVLQIGCGIGRFEVALSPYVRSAVGIDVSPKMIDAARRRAADLGNVRFEVCSGLDLANFEDGSFDVVYAVDSMPYLFAAGSELVETHFGEAARVLGPNGELVVVPFSYRADVEQDRADVRRLAHRYGFDVSMNGSAPFQRWNGRVFRMRRRPETATSQGNG